MWSQTLGHDKPIGQLKKALSKNKAAHAVLFCGVEGIGKKRVAIGLAQGLNCESPAPCERCLSCEKIAKKIHPDCLWIEPENKTIRIDVLRDLKAKAHLHPLEGKAKVFIIESAEKMTTASANALLKVLEEPPPATYFILITAKPSLLLPTIRSRCQRIEFAPLDETILATLLEQRGVASSDAQWRAQHSQGSLSQALALEPELFQGAAEDWKQVQQSPKAQTVLNLSERILEDPENLANWFSAISILMHQKILAAESNEALESLTEQWQVLQQASQGLDFYANKRLLVENLLFTLAAAPLAPNL